MLANSYARYAPEGGSILSGLTGGILGKGPGGRVRIGTPLPFTITLFYADGTTHQGLA